jgi:hypothetical protein
MAAKLNTTSSITSRTNVFEAKSNSKLNLINFGRPFTANDGGAGLPDFSCYNKPKQEEKVPKWPKTT